MPSSRGFLGLHPTLCRGCQGRILVPVAALLDGLPQKCPRCSDVVPVSEIAQADPALKTMLDALREESRVRAAPRRTQAGTYRFYLIDTDGRAGAEDSFPAGNDRAAKEIAASVYRACADVFRGYELWREGKCLAMVRNKDALQGELHLSAVVLAHQNSILDLEDRLQRSFGCVSRSKKLLATSAALRAL